MRREAAAILLALAVVVGASACRRSAEPEPEPEPGAAAAGAHAQHGAPPHAPPLTVEVDPRAGMLANVATARVATRRATTRILAAGRVTYDEARLARVTAWVDGRIQRLIVATTGAVVRKGTPIAEIYSPELVSTQQELLVALASARALAGSPVEGVAADSRRLAEAARRRLALWGLSGAQIGMIERRGRPLDVLPVLAPASGIVIRRPVQAGDWVTRGTPLFEIADLSRVWVEADVYEHELAGLRPGLPVEVEATAYPGEVFHGQIAFLLPTISTETRSNTVRVELANPGGRLKPGMLATATITVAHGAAVVVPADAVLDSGLRKIVWVEVTPGRFVARDVVVGASTEDGRVITRGLTPGETIAVSGGFMLDAASRLMQGGGPHAGHGTAPAEGAP